MRSANFASLPGCWIRTIPPELSTSTPLKFNSLKKAFSIGKTESAGKRMPSLDDGTNIQDAASPDPEVLEFEALNPASTRSITDSTKSEMLKLHNRDPIVAREQTRMAFFKV